MFSELDCSIEQEFCKAQEEDSKQVLLGGEQRKPQAKNQQPQSTQSHSHPQGLGQVVVICYQVISSVMSLIAAHTL